MKANASTAGGSPALMIAAVLGLTAIVVPFSENVAAGLAPLLVIGAAVFVWTQPLAKTIAALIFICLVADNPQERPAAGKWKSFLYPVGDALYTNLNKLTGIEALRFCALDLIFLCLVGVALMRAMNREREFARPHAASALVFGLALALGALLFLEVWGVVRGGDFKNSLWQIRQLVWLPILAGLCLVSFRRPGDVRALMQMIVWAACLKVAVGWYFYEFVAKPTGEKPPYVTTHSDSMLFVSAMMVLVTRVLERRSRRDVLTALFVIPIVMIGLVINDRRLAFVSLGACVFTLYLFAARATKRRVHRIALKAVPALALYTAVGWSSTSSVFKPVATVRSVILQEDRSSGTRDIENYNLLQTLKQQRLFGWGFGHEYLELVKADSIAEYFPLYRYIGHNSVLWLWSVAGLVGFTCFWMFLSIGVYLAARGYRLAQLGEQRAEALTAICIIISYIIQAYGDMGLQSWCGAFLVAASLAIANQVALATGAWPTKRRARARVVTLHAPQAPATSVSFTAGGAAQAPILARPAQAAGGGKI